MELATHARPRFRTDLVAECIEAEGQRFIDVIDPDTGDVVAEIELDGDPAPVGRQSGVPVPSRRRGERFLPAVSRDPDERARHRGARNRSRHEDACAVPRDSQVDGACRGPSFFDIIAITRQALAQ